MFTVLAALFGVVVFLLTLAFTKLNFKKAFINYFITLALGFLTDCIIGFYFITLAHLTL